MHCISTDESHGLVEISFCRLVHPNLEHGVTEIAPDDGTEHRKDEGKIGSAAADVQYLRCRCLNSGPDLAKTSATPQAIEILTWGGLRGGISVALALSIPPSPERHVILTITDAVRQVDLQQLA